MTLDTLTPRNGNTTYEEQTDERLLGLQDDLQDELGDGVAVYRDPDADSLAVEAERVTAELYAGDEEISVSYDLDTAAGQEAVDAVNAINDAVSEEYAVAVDADYGPVELGPRGGETVREPTFL